MRGRWGGGEELNQEAFPLHAASKMGRKEISKQTKRRGYMSDNRKEYFLVLRRAWPTQPHGLGGRQGVYHYQALRETIRSKRKEEKLKAYQDGPRTENQQ